MVAGGADQKNLQNVEQLDVSSGANTFVFGNDYWGGGNPGSTLAQAIPFVDVLARNAQGALTVDTKKLYDNKSPLVLDFRAVNYELYFTFSPIKDDPDAVTLTVRTVRDLEVPIIHIGPNIRNNTIVFTHVDRNTILYGGRYKNTFNFDKGANYQGHLIGGEGWGWVSQFAGHYTDHALEYLRLAESAAMRMSLPDVAEQVVCQVENTISYSNPILGITPVGKESFVTKVNLEVLKNQGQPKSALDKAAQFVAGNAVGPAIDRWGWTTTTGLLGLAEHTQDANLGEVIVRSGFNFVRGTDYSFKDVATWKANPTALLTSGADTISVGDNPASITPGFHLLAGGSGGDTYKFNSQYWGAALVLDDLYEVGAVGG